MKKKFLSVIAILFVLSASALVYYNNQTFSKKHSLKITKARNLLCDEKSKEIFDKVIKFYDTKQPIEEKYISNYSEYLHPNIPIVTDNILIDGGVSEDLLFTFDFGIYVGESGKVIGFEPNTTVIDKINHDIKNSKFKNITVYSVGLWDKNCTKTFYLKENLASSLTNKENSTGIIKVQLVKLDDFLHKNGINKVDFIKLDIEGAEIQALKGAKETIIKNKPNMAISAYHNKTDIYNIILYIKKLNPDYKFYLGYHQPYSSDFINVVLYATEK